MEEEKLYQRIRNSYDSIYLTIISIIQGTTLGYFAQYIDYVKTGSATHWILAVSIFLIIVETWDEYVVGTTSMIWLPNILDALIPFAFGALEIITIRSINNLSDFLMFLGFTSAIAFVAFLNLYIKSRGEPENRYLLQRVKYHIFLGHLFAFLGFIGCFVLRYFAIASDDANNNSILFGFKVRSVDFQNLIAISTLILVLCFFVRSVFYWHAVLQVAKQGQLSKATLLANITLPRKTKES